MLPVDLFISPQRPLVGEEIVWSPWEVNAAAPVLQVGSKELGNAECAISKVPGSSSVMGTVENGLVGWKVGR